jgi:tight adherence protein C
MMPLPLPLPLSWLVAVLAVGAAGLTGSFALIANLRRERRILQRLQGIRGTGGVRRARPAGSLLLRSIGALGTGVARSGVLSTKTIEELEQTLNSSGLRGSNGIGLFIGSKLLLFAALPTLALLLLPQAGIATQWTHLLAAIAPIVGLLLPDTIVKRNRESYLKRVDDGVADALDMMVISTQAGLGLESSFHRVAVEIAYAHPDLARELEATLSEMRIAVDTQRALANLGKRTGLPSLKRVTAMLGQTIQFGTPLSDALRVLSAEMRQEVLTKFEERAARLPVLMTIPMILFIFPCIFVVIAGPSAIQIMGAFSH